MCNSIQEPTIELVFQKFNTPVGPVYFVRRWGREKKCFSRDTAIRRLRLILARVRQRREWQTKWDSFVERTEKEREALKACKPF